MNKEVFFGIKYTFGKNNIISEIDTMLQLKQKGYICVADGVTLSMSHKNEELRKVVEQSSMTICDSGWVPTYLKFLYNIHREQYCGSDFLIDLVSKRKYKLMFLGACDDVLSALKDRLSRIDSRIENMIFQSLPFLEVTDFDYKEIARQINESNPDIIFVSLGMPKQEFFMSYLLPHINTGILTGVGAAFKFHSGLSNQKRAPEWMIKMKLEWLHRIFSEPNKQLKRCWLIVSTMPSIYWKEYRKKKKNES